MSRRHGAPGIRRGARDGAAKSAPPCTATLLEASITIPSDTDTYTCGLALAADVSVSIAADNSLTITEA